MLIFQKQYEDYVERVYPNWKEKIAFMQKMQQVINLLWSHDL